MILLKILIKKSRQIAIVTFSFFFINSYGQKTPQDLGEITFNFLKSENYYAIDTLTPKASEIIGILKQKYSTTQIDTSHRFLKKYEYHDRKFKNKCRDIRNDTIEIKINWDKAILSKVEFYEKPYTNKDTSDKSKPILVNYLDILFASNSVNYILQFKAIYFNKGIWKLGEHVHLIKSN